MFKEKPRKNMCNKGLKCRVPGCGHNARVRGLCVSHYINPKYERYKVMRNE